MAGIIRPVVCEQEAAQRLAELTNSFSKAELVDVIKHWESKYELLDKYSKDLAAKNQHWEASWPYHQKMVTTRIEQREVLIKGLTQANQSLVQENAGFVKVVNVWQELVQQRDTEIMGLKQEKVSLAHSLSASTNWQEKYNALAESSKSLEENKPCPESNMETHVDSVEEDNTSLAQKVRREMAEKRQSWASLSKLIKEKFQKIEDKKSHLEDMSTKDLAEKQDILEVEVKVENILEAKSLQDPAEEQHQLETGMVTEVQKMEEQEEKFTEEESTQDLVETPEVDDEEEESTQDLVETPEVDDEEEESTQDLVETPEVDDEEEESTQDLVETPEVDDEEEESTQDLVETPEVDDEEEESTQDLVETPEVDDEEEESTQDLVETPEVEEEEKEPEEFTDFPKTEAAEVELPEEELSLVAAVAIKDQRCETTEVEKKEPEEFSFLKKTEEVVLQKEKSRKKKKQQKKRVKDIKLQEKFPEAQAEKRLALDEELIKPEESMHDLAVETPNCWESNFRPIWMKVKPTEDSLANRDQLCDTTEGKDEEKEPEKLPEVSIWELPAGEAGLQGTGSGEEKKLSWAAVVANKDQRCRTREKKVEEEVKDPEEVSESKTEAGEEVLLTEKSRKEKKQERKGVKALKVPQMGIIVKEMDNPDNRGQSCETSEVTEEREEVEQFPDLPNTEAREVALQKMEMGEVTKRSWAAVLKDQSCRIREKKVKDPEEGSDLKQTEAVEVKDPEEGSDLKQTEAVEVKDPEEGSDLKQTEAVEVKDPEEGSDLKQTEAVEVKDPEEGSDLKQTEAVEGEVKDPEEGQTPVEGRVRMQRKKSRKDKKKEKKREEYNRGHC
nr:probable serine/threonine-protein kinase kinX isoform X1 [Pseudochaenichthys georgianus]XP_033956227.1 probable serine/threonine-protein kinase kinX isoform X2 [Pseudochaenichthys georgianus]